VELEDCTICELEEQVASRNGFIAVTHKLEFFGVCPACQSRK
jgi:Fe2+ or Zn2+ uptake regulation protein